jgi:hypothetical protein
VFASVNATDDAIQVFFILAAAYLKAVRTVGTIEVLSISDGHAFGPRLAVRLRALQPTDFLAELSYTSVGFFVADKMRLMPSQPVFAHGSIRHLFSNAT